MHIAMRGKEGLIVSLLTAITFLLFGLLSRGYCPLNRAFSPWYRIFIHNLGFAIAIALSTSLLESIGVLFVSSVIGFTMFTLGRAMVCGSLTAFLVALLEAIAYLLSYLLARVERRWKVLLSSVMVVLLLVASLIESGVV